MKVKIYYSDSQKAIPTGFAMKCRVRSAVKALLEQEKFPYDAELSVSFVTDEEIHEMNREHRGIDRPTDVLSFPLTDGKPGPEDILDGSVMLGDIVISGDTALRQSAEYGHSIEREVCFLTVHSMLHLLGYDHEQSKEDEDYMNESCERILLSMGLPRTR